jgi:tRNA nucleotidyltransferase (CCA-adding enzyme)
MFDPHAATLLDFFGGEADLRARILRHTSDAFGEDPLRVLRGMQLAARFDLSVAPETAALCRSIRGSYAELAVERIALEWSKWAEKSVRPSRGLLFLSETGWLEHFPEIAAMRGTPQEPDWHPEGDVFAHTCLCLDALVGLPVWQAAPPETRRVYSFAVLAHDFGKPATTTRALKDGIERIVSPEHDERGVGLADQFLERIGLPQALRERVLPLIGNHLAHLQAPSDRAVRRLARRLAPATITELAVVIEADQRGRPPLPAEPPEELEALLARARELEVQDRAPRPILLGRHLQALGMQAGPAFGPILAQAFEAQLEGKFTDLDGSHRWLAASGLLPPDARARLLAQLSLEHGPG